MFLTLRGYQIGMFMMTGSSHTLSPTATTVSKVSSVRHHRLHHIHDVGPCLHLLGGGCFALADAADGLLDGAGKKIGKISARQVRRLIDVFGVWAVAWAQRDRRRLRGGNRHRLSFHLRSASPGA